MLLNSSQLSLLQVQLEYLFSALSTTSPFHLCTFFSTSPFPSISTTSLVYFTSKSILLFLNCLDLLPIFLLLVIKGCIRKEDYILELNQTFSQVNLKPFSYWLEILGLYFFLLGCCLFSRKQMLWEEWFVKKNGIWSLGTSSILLCLWRCLGLLWCLILELETSRLS